MTEAVVIALITTIGLVLIEFLRRSANSKKDLQAEIRELRERIDELQNELIEYQEKYLLLLRQLAKEVKQ